MEDKKRGSSLLLWSGTGIFAATALISWLMDWPGTVQGWLNPEAGFAKPQYLSLLFLIPAAAFLGKLLSLRGSAALNPLVSPKLQKRLILDESPGKRRLRNLSLFLGWTLLIVSLAGPQWGTKIINLKRRGIDIVIALDLSESMLAKDAPSAEPGKFQRRLDLAKKKIQMLMELAKNERIGIIAFAGKPITLCPLTTDHNTCAIWLNSLDPRLIPYGGTAIADTIKAAIPLFALSGENSKALFILTDGDDHQKNTEDAAKKAAEKGIKIFALGFGSTREIIIPPSQLPPPPPGVPADPRPIKTKLNQKLLQKIAKITGGKYLKAEASFRDVRELFQLARSQLKAYTHQSRRITIREERYQPFLSLALLFLLLAWLVPKRISLPGSVASIALPLLLVLTGCRGDGNSEGYALYNSYREGLRLFEERQYDKALELFKKLQAKAPHRSDLMYNIGTVYLQKALKLDPKKDKDKRNKLLQQAIENFRLALQKGGGELRQKAYYNLGLAYTYLNQLESALFHFDAAAKLALKLHGRPDRDAEENRDKVAALLRMRERKRRELNRKRVFLFTEKMLVIKTPKPIKNPAKSAALRATFTHRKTGKKYTAWGYPLSPHRWAFRFVPHLRGKWTYKIESVRTKVPGYAKETSPLEGFEKKGEFKAVPSTHPGQLTISRQNNIRMAWTKFSLKKAQKKEKKGAKKEKGSNKKKGAKEKIEIVREEKIFRWAGLVLPELFGPKADDKEFERHKNLIQIAGINAVYVPIELKNILDEKSGELQSEYLQKMANRLDALREDPLSHPAFVIQLNADGLPLEKFKTALYYAILRFSHRDIIWSLTKLPKKYLNAGLKILRQYDPYRQPVALPYSKELEKKIAAIEEKVAARTQKSRKHSQKKPPKGGKSHTAQKARKKEKVAAEKDKKQPVQKKRDPLRLYLWETDFIKSQGPVLAEKLSRPWLVTLPLPTELNPKQFLKVWWKLYISGLQISIRPDRPFRKDEFQSISKWLEKVEPDKLPPHPDPLLTKATTRPTTAPTTAPKTRPSHRAQKNQKSEKIAWKTPREKRLSRAFIHYLTVRFYWEKFLNSFRFSELIKPELVSVKFAVPGKKPKEFKLRGVMASNGLTILYVPPIESASPPNIQWRDSRWDLLFTWYNAERGEFLPEKLYRQVLSLTLTKPPKEAHIAKVSVKDHYLYSPYTIALPGELLKKYQGNISPKPERYFWRAPGWTVKVVPPKVPAQLKGKLPSFRQLVLPLVLTRSGYSVRFRPVVPGIWSFYFLYKGRELQGEWKYPIRIKVVPGGRVPPPLFRSKERPEVLFAGGRPFFTAILPYRDLLSQPRESIEKNIRAVMGKNPAVTVIASEIPALQWPAAFGKDRDTERADTFEAFDKKLEVLAGSGYQIALIVPKRWEELSPEKLEYRLRYLLERYYSAYPIIWIERKDSKIRLSRTIKGWYLQLISPPTVKKGGAGNRQADQPSLFPPLLAKVVGSPRSEKELQKLAREYDLLWLTADDPGKIDLDFKLRTLKVPIALAQSDTVSPLTPLLPPSERPEKRGEEWLTKRASFMWRSQLRKFGHSFTPVEGKLKFKPVKNIDLKDLPPESRIATTLRIFISSIDWSKLSMPLKKFTVKSEQAEGADAPSKDSYHAVIWVRETVRRHFSLGKRGPTKLKGYRYLWLDPVSGKRPTAPQLLPKLPTGRNFRRLEMPEFRPAVFYIFKVKKKKSRSSPQMLRKFKKREKLSKRQQIKNRLRNLSDIPRQLWKKQLDKMREKLKRQLPPKRG